MDSALDYLRRAVALTPDAVTYQYNLALVLSRFHQGRQRNECAFQQYDGRG